MNNTKASYHGKVLKSKSRHAFLLTFFDNNNRFDVKEVNGFILNRYFNKGSGAWEVMVYTKESWKKAQDYLHGEVPAGQMSDSRQTTIV